MIKTKNKIFLISLMLMILLSSAFLFACGKDDEIKVTSTEHGSVVHIKNDSEEIYNAIPEKWHTFAGWYDGYKKYSENPSLKVTSQTPKNLEARFASTGTLTFDRILNSLYNTYSLGLENSGEYFNINSSGKFTFTIGEKKTDFVINLSGYINFVEKLSEIALKLNSVDNEKLYSLIYKNNNENGFIYIDQCGNKLSYKDLGLLTNVINSLPSPSQYTWNIENILNNDTAYYQFEQYFGLLNASGIIENVVNSENSSLLALNLQKLLNLLKNFYPTLEEDSFSKNLADVLLENYKEESFPRISVTLKVDYAGVEKEKITKLELIYDLSKDYKLNFAGKDIIIPKGNFDFVINNLEYGFENLPNEIEDNLENYPKNEYNLLNFHVGGELQFAEEDHNVIDSYSVELDADLNPFALIAFKSEVGNYYDIEWEKLGFLSFRVVLNISEDESEALQQYKRHKNATDYINILIDTKRFGGKVLVYSAFYDPSTMLTTSYFINNSFDITKLFNNNTNNELSTIKLNEESIDNPTLDLSDIVKLLIDMCLNFDKNDINQSFYEIFSMLFGDIKLLEDNIKMTENGVEFYLNEVRDFIRNRELELGLTLGGKPIKTDKYLFGEENITKLILNFDCFEYDCIRKNSSGYYVDNNDNSFLEEYNKHSTLIEVSELNVLEGKTIDEIIELKGSVITADKGLFSDGTESDTYLSNKGKNEIINLYVADVKVRENNGKYEVELDLFIQAPFNEPNLLETTLSDVLYDNFKIPYGFYSYNIYI